MKIGECSLYNGDCLEVMAALTEKLDAVVTDPPYHLTSIVQRFGKAGAAPAQEGSDGRFARASRGFMGKEWDGGDVAFKPETWRLCWELLKPGAHLIAFSGTRTYHRMACAIEDAGFEIRDQLAWCYGSGFPKSHDVSKGIDKAAGHWRGRAGEKTRAGESFGQEYEREPKGDPITAAAAAAAAWEGWGTALKPAWEPIVLARKPLMGTVAENVLAHGTGAINVDGCRVGEFVNITPSGVNRHNITLQELGYRPGSYQGDISTPGDKIGRWPANIIHDGSDEVMAAFPSAPGQLASVGPEHGAKSSVNVYGDYGAREHFEPRSDSGSAARFFYSAKADADDRFGSKHPTVKPVDLMAWLIRLVTPRGGLVMDPFAGSGTTGVAAMREGCRAVLIERDKEYFEDIIIRLRHTQGKGAHSGSLKTRNKTPREALPLFPV